MTSVTLTVPAFNPEFHDSEDLARQTLETVSLTFVQQAQDAAQVAHTAAEGLSWDNPEHAARLEAADQATKAWHTLAYVHNQVFGNAGLPSLTRPAHLPIPAPSAPRLTEEPYVIVPGDEDDRL